MDICETWIGFGAYGDSDGYAWAANLLWHFLDGTGTTLQIVLPANDPFINDPGITRATRSFGEPSSKDEADK